MAEYLCQFCMSSPWTLMFLLLAEVVMVGAVMYSIYNWFFRDDYERRMMTENNEKRIERIEEIMKEKGDLDTRAPWNR